VRFDPQGCSRLIDAGFASGAVAEMAPSSYRDRRAAAKIYWPATLIRGAERGRSCVRADQCHELFGRGDVSAVMQDNAIAKIVGVRTGGDGCGFMEDTPPVVIAALASALSDAPTACDCARTDRVKWRASRPICLLPQLMAKPSARAARLLSTVVGDAKSSGDQPVARK